MNEHKCGECGEVDEVDYSLSDWVRSGQVHRADFVDRKEIASLIHEIRAEEAAAERERCAKQCDGLEAEFAKAYESESDAERQLIQRSMADAFAQAARIIRDGEP